MKKLTTQEQKMSDWDNELRFESADYSDIRLIDVAQKAINFAFNNFKEKETMYEGYVHQYEGQIENVALGIDSHLQNSPKNKKSKVIRSFVLNVVNTEEYGRGRSGFIYLLSVLKMDKDLEQIARDRKDFWKISRIQFQLLHALFRRKIKGFEEQAKMLIEHYSKETELRKYANKYLEQQTKLK